MADSSEIEKKSRFSQVQLLLGFPSNFTGVKNVILSCAHCQHVPLRCTKWQPDMHIEKSSPSFTGQTFWRDLNETLQE
jgi:hypothetical protein